MYVSLGEVYFILKYFNLILSVEHQFTAQMISFKALIRSLIVELEDLTRLLKGIPFINIDVDHILKKLKSAVGEVLYKIIFLITKKMIFPQE